MKDKNISYLTLGLCLGVVFGLIFDNLATVIGIGLAVGAGLDSAKK